MGHFVSAVLDWRRQLIAWFCVCVQAVSFYIVLLREQTFVETFILSVTLEFQVKTFLVPCLRYIKHKKKRRPRSSSAFEKTKEVTSIYFFGSQVHWPDYFLFSTFESLFMFVVFVISSDFSCTYWEK